MWVWHYICIVSMALHMIWHMCSKRLLQLKWISGYFFSLGSRAWCAIIHLKKVIPNGASRNSLKILEIPWDSQWYALECVWFVSCKRTLIINLAEYWTKGMEGYCSLSGGGHSYSPGSRSTFARGLLFHIQRLQPIAESDSKSGSMRHCLPLVAITLILCYEEVSSSISFGSCTLWNLPPSETLK